MGIREYIHLRKSYDQLISYKVIRKGTTQKAVLLNYISTFNPDYLLKTKSNKSLLLKQVKLTFTVCTNFDAKNTFSSEFL